MRSSLLKDISRRRNLQRNKGKRSATAKPQLLRQSPGHLQHHLCLLLTFIICIFNLFDHANIGVVALAAPKTVSQARRQRSVEKARAKVHAFVAANSASSNATTTTNTIHQVTFTRPSVLVVDGNNVRGIGQCEWSPVEWMERVAAFCQAYRVDHYVVVWDHGPSPTVIALPHYNSNKQQQSSNNSNNNNHQNLCLFAGLSQRADDVMVHEATYLREYYCSDRRDDTHNDKEGADDTPDNTKSTDQTDHFHNFCFITNDGGLQGRLQQLGSDPRLRVLNTNRPLVLDATRFIALVQGVPLMDSHDNNSKRDPEAPNSGTKDLDLVHQSVYRAEGQLQSFFAAKDSPASSLPSSEETPESTTRNASKPGNVVCWQTLWSGDMPINFSSNNNTMTFLTNLPVATFGKRRNIVAFTLCRK